MLLFILVINYLLIILFLNSYYAVYFIILILLIYGFFTSKVTLKRNSKYLSVVLILITSFGFIYFDDEVFYLYLYLHLDEIYISIDSKVTYILALLHSLILFGL